jgi:hypothetical protein
MVIPTDTYMFFIATLFYAIAAGYLLTRIRTSGLVILKSLGTYLIGISTFFLMMGLYQLVQAEILLFLGALAITVGASTIARFPLKLEWPSIEKIVYLILLVGSSLSIIFSFVAHDIGTTMRFAHGYAFVVAGLFTMGYIFYAGMKAKSAIVRAKSIGTATSMALCCVVAHGLVTFQLFASVAVPLFGIFTLNAPMIFALLSPISLLLVLHLSKYLGIRRTHAKKEFKRNTQR